VQSCAIVLAAGGGDRFGGAKQFARIGGVTVLDRAVGVARESCDQVVVVLPPGAQWDAPGDVRTATGGATRSASVRAGLAQVPEDADVVVVHDAARPLASRGLYARVIAAIVAGADGAVPALPVIDTIKRVDGDNVVDTVPRAGLVAVQTPQAFRADVLRASHANDGIDTDDAALVEVFGGKVVIVEGERRNVKITHAPDLELAQTLHEGPTS
jgi:2-C-methyl-D-erythritol 4-phosphate cytidylyltransferase